MVSSLRLFAIPNRLHTFGVVFPFLERPTAAFILKGPYLGAYSSWVLKPFVHGRFQNLKTGKDTVWHVLTRDILHMFISHTHRLVDKHSNIIRHLLVIPIC